MKKYMFVLLAVFLAMPCLALAQEEASATDPWQQAAVFEAGGDLGCQIVVLSEVEKSLADESSKKAMAEKAASFLNENSTTLGRQFYCVQLRVVGGEEQVPILAKYVKQPVEGYVARAALTKIGGSQAAAVLNEALDSATDESVIGFMDSLAQLGDETALPKIAKLAQSENAKIAYAAVWSLSKYGTKGHAVLKELGRPVSCQIAGSAALEIAQSYMSQGDKESAGAIYESLCVADAPRGVRRAAAVGLLKLADDPKQQVNEWLFGDDNVKATIACAWLGHFSDEEVEAIYAKLDRLNPAARTACLTVVMSREGEKARQVALEGLASDDLQKRINAIHALTAMQETDNLAQIMDCAANATEPTELAAISELLVAWGESQVGDTLMDAMNKPALRTFALDNLARMKCYRAIDPILALARGDDEPATNDALDALAQLCDPDSADMPRLLAFYLETKPGKVREQAERTIVRVCEKLADLEARADLTLDFAAAAENPGATRVALLPLLGKLGGAKVRQLLEPLLTDGDPAVQAAALRALCNWPNAAYLDDLWNLADNAELAPAYRQMALRAFVRVATLKSDRPESETLAMLQNAMKIATTAPDRNWCLKRAATVRTLESANWAAACLDDPALAETACSVIVELAHHRFLRQPNKARFEEILTQVEAVTKDAKTAELAKKARLGM
ncbi:MAG: hypothetical protein Q4G68_07200 [Planctomycetia bacterium]|nr:hypothetical protein [Planctomycetia bacterium]